MKWEAYRSKCKPYFVSWIGTNVDNAKKLLKDSGLSITSAGDLDEAAKKAVACLS